MNKMTLGLGLCLLIMTPWAEASVTLDGTDDWLSVPTATTLDASSTGISVGAWIYVGATGEQVIMDRRGNGGSTCGDSGPASGGWELRVVGGAFPLDINFIIKDNSTCPGNEAKLTASGQVSQNTWTHVAGTFNNSTDATAIYVNGASVATGSTTKDPSVSPNTRTFGIGDTYAYDSTPPTTTRLNGRIDDPFVSQTVLSAAQVANLAGFTKRMPLQMNSLGAYWPLDECADAASCSNSFGDMSGNSNTATQNGNPTGNAELLTYP